MSDKEINNRKEDFFEMYRFIFNNTFLKDFFLIKKEDYIEPHVKKSQSEIIVAKMNDAEKILYTILVRKYLYIKELSELFGMEEKELYEILESKPKKMEELVEYHQEQSELMYEINEEEFPYDKWAEILAEMESYTMIISILNFMIYHRLMPDYYCQPPLLRQGFFIVKEAGELLEDDSSFEDEEKISSQNYPLN